MTAILCLFITVLFCVYVLVLRRRASSVEFAAKGILTGEKLGYMVTSLAYNSKRIKRGNGVGLRTIKKRLYDSYKVIAARVANNLPIEDCEKSLFDSFYYINEMLVKLKAESASFKNLPHTGALPRAYFLCELLVKSNGGFIDKQSVSGAVNTYCAETPLTFAEILSIDNMLTLALCEYIAIYAGKIRRMRELLDKGEADAEKGTSDYLYNGYAAYLYGYYGFGGDSEVREKTDKFITSIANFNARITAAIKSLHNKNSFLSDAFVNSLSPVYTQFNENDKTFHMLSETTKRYYLSAVSDVSRKRKISERSVVNEILFKSAKQNKDISEFIIPAIRGRTAAAFYIAATVVFTVTAAILFAVFAARFAWIYSLLGLPIFAFTADFIAHKICKRTVKRRYLPAYAFKYIDSDKYRTQILLPCFAASNADVSDAFKHLSTVAAANPESIFSYCILFDYPKHKSEISPDDADLNDSVIAHYNKLGKLKNRVCILVRHRKKVEGESYWQGHEKKRGAVMDFCKLLISGEGDFALKLGNADKTNYMITLDSDTLTSDCAEMVCIKAHPYCLDKAILSLNCKSAYKHSRYAKLFGGELGPARYRNHRESISFDLFGVGNYTGKGIYDVNKFYGALNGFFPDNRILSHDYIEGAVAGCYDTTVNASEDFPQSFSSGFKRELRWLRGDWQLLPYTTKKVNTVRGKTKNPIGSVASYSIALNLTLSLVPVSQMLLFAATLFYPPNAAVIILMLFPQILRAVFSLGCILDYPKQTAAEICRCGFELAVLPTVAFNKLCAVIVTLYRLAVKRRLLEWSVFAHTRGEVSNLPNIVASIVFAVIWTISGFNVFYFITSVAFGAGAYLPALLSTRSKPVRRSDELKAMLTDTAKSTFEYFSKQETLYKLPCDCFQADNMKGWCARTSPTNIGMALTAYASAYEIGLIEKERLLSYIEKTVSAVEKCEKYHGNLYNWYDCDSLAVLPKRFVSSVDSGNFLASLYLTLTYTSGKLNERVRALIDNTDLSVLFDPERKLFYIGYDDEIKSCTFNHYDLLGSESTLTYLIACGAGLVDKEAFFNLDRHAVKYGNAVTVFSWTGGMFEYLMSRLFIAPEQGTLYDKAMNGAVRAHIKYARMGGHDVWGISECRYAEYDDAGGNLYRAFGVGNIAHSTVPENPPFAPYAACIALPYCTDSEFMQAMGAFDSFGMRGDMGYYESLCGDIPVKSYMTHHQGMIMAACANALKSDCIVRRLQTLPEWRAARLLCGEEGAARARRKKTFKISAAEHVADCGIYLCKTSGMTAVANRKITRINYHGKTILEKIRIIACDEAETDLLSGEFGATHNAVWRINGNGFISEAELAVLPSPLSVAVKVKYRNVSAHEKTVRFKVGAEPILSDFRDYTAHPAYSKMFIETGLGGSDKYMWARRAKESVTVVHCVSAASEPEYGGDKCEFYGRGRGTRFGKNVNPYLSSALEFNIKTGESAEFTCYYLLAETTEQTEYAARLALSGDCAQRLSGASSRLSKGVSERTKKLAASLMNNEFGSVVVEGVSSDRPAIVCEVTQSAIAKLPEYLADLRALYEFGFMFNTVLFCRKPKNEYPAVYLDAECAVERLGVRAVAGSLGSVTVIKCADSETYSRLKNHKPHLNERQKVAYLNGKLVPADNAAKSEYALKPIKAEREERELIRKTAMGGFCENQAYFVDITDSDTPATWCNIISNGRIGTVLTESGGGFTFAANSREHKLTEWNNDPVCDKVSELFALACGGEYIGLTKKPLNTKAAYTVTHALGYSEFTCAYNGIYAKLKIYISRDDDKKICKIALTNRTDSEFSAGVIFAVKPVLGAFSYNTVSSFEFATDESGLEIYGDNLPVRAYMCGNGKVRHISADVENGELTLYGSLSKQSEYNGIITPISVGAGETESVMFSLSADKSEPYDFTDSEGFDKACAFYNRLSKITFDGEFGYLTKWLPYQVYNSRFAARAGFYQVSGAYGFRDQLQDCLTLLYCNPELVREHILECARHQFTKGDVQHWWHPPAVGVRTHVCDDRLWLVYLTSEYIAHTGDKSILAESVPYLNDVPITPQDVSVYTSAVFTDKKASLYEHCIMAIAVSIDLAENGLVLMRGGDWNDAMDKVGARGAGTSVWCSMFLYYVIERFMTHVKNIDLCDRLRKTQSKLYSAVVGAFENDRFLRAYTDDGAPLGSDNSPACKIDLLTQSWSVIAGIGTSAQKAAALESAYNHLCDSDNKIIKLFTPPFTSSEGVGYIGDYPLGVRENGGQYTQAAVWYVWALFNSGNRETANKLLKWLSPANRCESISDLEKYCVEPYVSAADVYAGELIGKGGWTWYTGSASWLYKCLIEQYAGIKMRGNVVSFNPNLPADTPELNVDILHGGEHIKVKIINSDNGGDWRVRIGKVVYNTASLKLTKGLSDKNIALIRLLK